MSEFDFSVTLSRLIIRLASLRYETVVDENGVSMIEKWELKYPN